MEHIRIDPIVPSDEDAIAAAAARDAIAAGRDVTLRELPALVKRLLMQILEETESGNAVSLIPVEAEISTQQAADILGVSRPFLVGLVDKGELPVRLVGTHRRLSLRDVLDFKAGQYAKRSKVLDELAAQDQALGLL